MTEETRLRAGVAREMAAEVLPCACGRGMMAPVHHDESCPARARGWLIQTIFALIDPVYTVRTMIPCTCGAEGVVEEPHRLTPQHPETCPAAHRDAVVGHIRQAAMQAVSEGSPLEASQGALAAVRALRGADLSKDLQRCLSAAERTLAGVFDVLGESHGRG